MAVVTELPNATAGVSSLIGALPAARPGAAAGLFDPVGQLTKASAVSTVKPAVKAKPFDATATQKFLNAKGYLVPVDGINGPLTQAAAAAFRSHADPSAFNVGHGLSSGAPATPAPVAAPTKPAPAVKPPPAKPIAGRNPTAGFSTDTPTAGTGGSGSGNTGTGTGTGGSTGAGGTGGTVPGDTGLAQARQTVSAFIDPLIKEIEQAETQRVQQGQSLISGYTTNAEKQLAGINFAQPYQQAAGDQNAINTALLSILGGTGAAQQNQLGSTLAAAGQDPGLISALTGKIGTDTTGAQGAGLAKGDASLSAINQEGAAAQTYGNKQPGITALAGLQDSKGLQGQVATDEGKQLSTIEAKVPGMVQSELGTLSAAKTKAAEDAATASENATKNQLAQEGIDATTRNNAIKTITANGVDPKTGLLTPTASALLSKLTGAPVGTFTGLGAKDALTAANDATKNALTKQGLDLKKQQINETWATNQQKIAFGYDKLNATDKIDLAKIAQGNKKLALQAAVAQNKASQMSPDSYTKLLQNAHTQADNFYYGIPAKVDASGATTVPAVAAVQYPQALSQLLSQHVKLADALNILNAFYAPGEGGRPAATKAK